MKMMYIYEIESRHAWTKNTKCACGNTTYEVIMQREPISKLNWFVRCPACGTETNPTSSRTAALDDWRNLCYHV